MPTTPEKARASSSKHYQQNREKILEKMKAKRQEARENNPTARPVGRPKIVSQVEVKDAQPPTVPLPEGTPL